MYCIQCGVELADTQKNCPLCGTRVYHPDIKPKKEEPFFPEDKIPAVKQRSLWPQMILTALFLIPIYVVLVCDILLNGSVGWSGYVVSGLLLGYVLIILPLWFVKPNPVVFVPCDFAAVALFLLYINFAVGGSWYLSFALPVTGFLCLHVTAVVTLLKYVPKGWLYILGGATVALGGFLLLVEYLAMITFDIFQFVGWSLYPLGSLVILGGLLIFLAICRPAREKMERKLFI